VGRARNPVAPGADVLEQQADELALLLSRENEKPVQDALQNDVSFLIAIFRFFGSLADKLPTDSGRSPVSSPAARSSAASCSAAGRWARSARRPPASGAVTIAQAGASPGQVR
jgi:hypothetical protein